MSREWFALYDAYRAWRKLVSRRYRPRSWGHIGNPFTNPRWPAS